MNLARIFNKSISFCFFFFKWGHLRLAYILAYYKLPKKWASGVQIHNDSLIFTSTGNAICIAQLQQFEFSLHFLFELLSNPMVRVKETSETYFKVEIEGLIFKVASLSNMAVLYEIFIEKIYAIESVVNDLVVIDIGMNVGVASLYFAHRPDVKKVYGYEPFPATFAEAKVNISENPIGLQKIVLKNEGVSNINEIRSITLFESGLLSASTIEQNNSYGKKIGERINVQMVSIESVFEYVLLENPSAKILLKLDCEGEEYAIFEKLQNTSYLDNVVIAIIEWHEKGSSAIENVLNNYAFNIKLQPHISENSGMIYAIKK